MYVYIYIYFCIFFIVIYIFIVVGHSFQLIINKKDWNFLSKKSWNYVGISSVFELIHFGKPSRIQQDQIHSCLFFQKWYIVWVAPLKINMSPKKGTISQGNFIFQQFSVDILVCGCVLFWLAGKNQVPLPPPKKKKITVADLSPIHFWIPQMVPMKQIQEKWWFIYFLNCHPDPWGDHPIWRYIIFFQVGWFNHQLEKNGCLGYVGDYSTH